MRIAIVGSLAFDTIETPTERREKIVGGAGTYASLAASFFAKPGVVSVVGSDFPSEVLDLMTGRGIDLKGVEIREGKTFFWEGRYGDDPNQRTTLKTEVNVFEDFEPQLNEAYRNADIFFLGNIDPDLQEDILAQVKAPQLIAMDTISLWIETKGETLLKTLKKVDVFFANDEEVKMLTGERNLITAGKKLLTMGPDLIVAKKGEHGALLIGEDFVFSVPAYPSENVIDPTGAGDSFAGGFLGYLDSVGSMKNADFRRAAVYGSVMASFVIEDFGIERLKALSEKDIKKRYNDFEDLVSF